MFRQFLRVLIVLLISPFISPSVQASSITPDSVQVAGILSKKTFPFAKGIEWKAYDKGLEQAKKEKKIVFIQFYAKWCYYCKKLHTDVLIDKEVQTELNQNFVSVMVDTESKNEVMVDGEKVTESQLALAHKVFSTPTLYFLASDSKVIGVNPGYIPLKDFKKVLTYFSQNAYKKMKFKAYLEQAK